MMRIGIDACCWSNRRGFGRFTRELVQHMADHNRVHHRHELVLVVDKHTAARWEPPRDVESLVVDTHHQPTRMASADRQRSLGDLRRMGKAVAHGRFDVFFFPAVYSFFPIPRVIPTVVTFHDVIAENHPSLIFSNKRSRLAWWTKVRLALRQADQLLTVSNHAKQQIVRVFGYHESKILTVYEGAGEGFGPIKDEARLRATLDDLHLPNDKELILYVGGISPHKNLDGLMRAVNELERSTNWHLVITGDPEADGFLNCFDQLVAIIDELDLKSRVTFTGFVSDQALAALYNASTILVLPSFEEGFGLPVVEAMACGLPVAASSRGSLEEIVGPAGLLFDPDDHAQLANTLDRLLNDPQLRIRLIEEGQRRLSRFSWATSAEQVLEQLQRVANREAEIA